MKRSVEISRVENINENMCNQNDVLSCDAFELNLDLLSQHEPFDIHGLGSINLISLGKNINQIFMQKILKTCTFTFRGQSN